MADKWGPMPLNGEVKHRVDGVKSKKAKERKNGQRSGRVSYTNTDDDLRKYLSPRIPCHNNDE